MHFVKHDAVGYKLVHATKTQKLGLIQTMFGFWQDWVHFQLRQGRENGGLLRCIRDLTREYRDEQEEYDGSKAHMYSRMRNRWYKR